MPARKERLAPTPPPVDHLRALGAEVINDGVLRAGFQALAQAIQKGDLRAFELAVRLLYGPVPALRKSAAAALATTTANDVVRIYLPYNGSGVAPERSENQSGEIETPSREK